MGLHERGTQGGEVGNVLLQAVEFLHPLRGGLTFGLARLLGGEAGAGDFEGFKQGRGGEATRGEVLRGGVAALACLLDLGFDRHDGEGLAPSVKACAVGLTCGEVGLEGSDGGVRSGAFGDEAPRLRPGGEGGFGIGGAGTSGGRLGTKGDRGPGGLFAKGGQVVDRGHLAGQEDHIQIEACTVDGEVGLASGLMQLFLDAPIDLRAEQLLEDGASPLRVGGEELAELALRQHDDLAELFGRHADQLLHLGVDILDTPASSGDVRAFWSDLPYGGAGLDRNGAVFAALCRALLHGGALDAEAPGGVAGPEFELERDLGQHLGLGVVATQVGSIAFAPGTHAVQGEADGVKDGGLAGPDRPLDEEERPLTKLGEVNRRLVGEGAEGGGGQGDRAHQ